MDPFLPSHLLSVSPLPFYEYLPVNTSLAWWQQPSYLLHLLQPQLCHKGEDTPSSPLPLSERRTKIHRQGHFLAELPCPVPVPFCSFRLEWHTFILCDFQWSPLHPACTAMAKRNLDQTSWRSITPFIKPEIIRIDLGLSKMFFYNKVRKWSVWVNHIFLTTSYHLSYTYQTYFQRGRTKLHFCDFFFCFCLQFILCISLPCSALQDVKL